MEYNNLIIESELENPDRIMDGDTYLTIAFKVFNHFEIGQSCTIRGVTNLGGTHVEATSKLVLKEISDMDIRENIHLARDGRSRRKRKAVPNSIGDYLAHKIFKYEEKIMEGVPVATIWRIQ